MQRKRYKQGKIFSLVSNIVFIHMIIYLLNSFWSLNADAGVVTKPKTVEWFKQNKTIDRSPSMLLVGDSGIMAPLVPCRFVVMLPSYR
jgi:hypothetical protein